jgi:hypothetical protein
MSAAIWAWGCGACAPQKNNNQRRQTQQKTTKHNMPKEDKF